MTRKATEGPCVDFGGASFVQEPVERDITSHFLSKPVYYFLWHSLGTLRASDTVTSKLLSLHRAVSVDPRANPESSP